MNVIFLDIDEVMNSLAGTIRARQIGVPSHCFQGFNPISVALLKELVSITDAKIVLSSTWRMHYDTDEDCIEDFKKNMSLHHTWYDFPIIGRTPTYMQCRGEEIKSWLDLHYCMNYVIIDDSKDMLETQLNNFVHVDYREGFNFKNFAKCLKILGFADNHFARMGGWTI